MAIYDNIHSNAAIKKLQEATQPTKIASGTNVTISGSANLPFVNLEVFGQSIQDGTPTQDAPIDIGNAVISGIKTCGKNLFGGANPFNVTTYKTYTFPAPLQAGTYTVSALATSTDTGDTRCVVFDITNNKVLGYLTRDTRSSVTFTLTSECSTVAFYASSGYELATGDTATFTDIQIEVGGTATDFEEYTETAMTFTNPITLRDKDTLTPKEIKRKTERKVLDGTESWSIGYSGTDSAYFILVLGGYNYAVGNKCLSTHFSKAVITSATTNVGINIYNYSTSTLSECRLACRPNNVSSMTVATWTTYLAEQYANGTPVIVELELTDYVTEELPTADQIELNELETFNPKTNVLIDSTIEPELNLEYVNATFEEPTKMLIERIKELQSVVAVHDSDTLKVLKHGKRVTFELNGIPVTEFYSIWNELRSLYPPRTAMNRPIFITNGNNTYIGRMLFSTYGTGVSVMTDYGTMPNSSIAAEEYLLYGEVSYLVSD